MVHVSLGFLLKRQSFHDNIPHASQVFILSIISLNLYLHGAFALLLSTNSSTICNHLILALFLIALS